MDASLTIRNAVKLIILMLLSGGRINCQQLIASIGRLLTDVHGYVQCAMDTPSSILRSGSLVECGLQCTSMAHCWNFNFHATTATCDLYNIAPVNAVPSNDSTDCGYYALTSGASNCTEGCNPWRSFIDRGGLVGQLQTLTGHNLTQCLNDCMLNPKCLAITYHEINAQICWQHVRVDQLEYNITVYNPRKSQFVINRSCINKTLSDCYRWFVYPATNYVTDDDSHTVPYQTLLEECQFICGWNTTCEAVHYYPSTKQCDLYFISGRAAGSYAADLDILAKRL